jgi:hypothetical protein
VAIAVLQPLSIKVVLKKSHCSRENSSVDSGQWAGRFWKCNRFNRVKLMVDIIAIKQHCNATLYSIPIYSSFARGYPYQGIKAVVLDIHAFFSNGAWVESASANNATLAAFVIFWTCSLF